MLQLPKTAAEKAYKRALEDCPSLEGLLRDYEASGCPFPTVREANPGAKALVADWAGLSDEKEVNRWIAENPLLANVILCPDSFAALCRWRSCKHVFRFGKTLRHFPGD